MTIRDPKRFMAGMWDYAIFDGCFGDSKVAMADIDGIVERRGKFLVLETKAPGAPIPYGQLLTIKALSATRVFTVIVAWGETNSPQAAQVYAADGVSPVFACDIAKLRRIVATWFRLASVRQPVTLSDLITRTS